MDLLQRPEVKSTYDKCKYIVKLWEHEFKKVHGRVPSKLDIREADKNVRDAYRKYFQLKTAAVEHSFADVDGFHSDEEAPISISSVPKLNTTEVQEEHVNKDATWGSHLDCKHKVIEVEPKSKSNSSFNSLITKKLFCGSKLSKRNPRKSLSFTQKKSESKIVEAPTFLSQTLSSSTQQDIPLSFEGIFSNKVKVVNATDQITAQPLNLIQSVLDNSYKPIKSVDSKWVERATSSYEEANYSSDDIVDNSDDDESNNFGRFAKKLKIDAVAQTNNVTKPINDEINASRCSLLSDTNEIHNDYQKVTEVNVEVERGVTQAFRHDNENRSEVKENNANRKSTRSTKFIANMTESVSDNEDPYATDNECDDPEFSLSNASANEKRKPTIFDFSEPETSLDKEEKEPAKKVRRKKLKDKIAGKEEEIDSCSGYELEYSIKPRVSVPRFRNLKKIITIAETIEREDEIIDEPIMKSKITQNREKLEQKVKSGSLNENFVQINLKKKIYARGKKSMTFSKYKKQLWKKKKNALAGSDMDMGGCDGGTLVCFTCGQNGHFARNCKQTKADTLLPLEADYEDECPYPTLEEAAAMAQNNVLARRKPNPDAVRKRKRSDEFLEENQANQISEEAIIDERMENDETNDNIVDVDSDIDAEKLLVETLKLEEEVAKLDLQMYLDHVDFIKPYYELNADGGVIKTPKEVYDVLGKFGHSAFRPGQERAIMRILSGQSTLVTLSTGSGKSLCYQLPAYLYSQRERCVSLIISPLVSLMEDQITGIPFFLKAACLHTNQTKTQREKVMEAISSGDLNILLVSPEAVVAGEKSSSGFGSILRRLPPIAFACIDEAHCVSQWSHNFRPSYLMICDVLRERMGVKTVLGLTATATRSTCISIINHLQIPDGTDGVISDTPLPDNLVLTVSKDLDRDQALLGLLASKRFEECKSIIIYCTRRNECDRIAGYLRTSLKSGPTVKSNKRKRLSLQAEPYHAGLAASRRRTVQKNFMSGELRIVVATVAFGMGINKADIRAVIHYNMPKNFESYVQEIGRAGRDGLPAHCHMFLDARGNDENELRRHIHANSIDRHVIRKLLQKIFIRCSCKENCPKHEVAFAIEETVQALDVPEENISTLLCYLELHENKYVQLLSSAYTRCKVISYGGNIQIKKAAKECPPLAMALALEKLQPDQNVFEFAVVDVSAAIGWDSGICKHKLKNLEWTTVNGQPKRSPISVQFSHLGFRLLAPGNLTDDQLDEALDSLCDHVTAQENTALLQLRAVHQTLIKAATPSYKSCVLEQVSDEDLKATIRKYFDSSDPLSNISLTESSIIDEQLLVSDIRSLVSTYKDNIFTGRAIARIFHGIMSPNYPAVIWGRCKYWRKHINVDFNSICKIATREILHCR